MQNLEKSRTKIKITKTKVRSVGGDGGAVEEMMEIWPKPGEISPDPMRSHQIRWVLIRSDNQTHCMLASRTSTSTPSSPPSPHALSSSIHLSTPTASSTKTQNQKNTINTKSEGWEWGREGLSSKGGWEWGRDQERDWALRVSERIKWGMDGSQIFLGYIYIYINIYN